MGMEYTINPETLNTFIPFINKIDLGTTFDEKFKLSISIGLFMEKSISLEKAAELSGKSLANFIDLLNSKNIPWAEYTEDHLKQDDQAIKKYFQDTDT